MEKITITRKKLMDVWNVLETLGEKTLHIKAMYAIVKNRKSLADEIEAIKEAAHPPAGFIEYEKARIALCEQYCKRDEAGQPIIDNQSFQFEESKVSEFQEELKQLQEKHSADIDAAKELDKQMGQLIEGEVEIDIYTVSANVLEDGGLTLAQFEMLVNAGIITDPE